MDMTFLPSPDLLHHYALYALGWIFFTVLVTLAIIILRDHGLLFFSFGGYLASSAIAAPFYLLGRTEWYWMNLAGCFWLLASVQEAVDLRLCWIVDEAVGRVVRATRWASVCFGVVLAGLVFVYGNKQFNTPGVLQMIWSATLAFSAGRLFTVWLYGVMEFVPCPKRTAGHVLLLMAYAIPSLMQMMIRIGPKDSDLYWTTRSLQTVLRTIVLLGWIGLFKRAEGRKKSGAEVAV
jgi:hypothetical protein